MAKVLVVGDAPDVATALGELGYVTETTPDPMLLGPLMMALPGTSAVVYLADPAVAELHDERLGTLLAKLVDTPVRGFIYAGTEGGAALVADAAERWQLPVAVVAERDARAVAEAVEELLG